MNEPSFPKMHWEGWIVERASLTIRSGVWDLWSNWNVWLNCLIQHLGHCSCYCCLVTHSCLALCDPMDCNTIGFPVLRYLLEFAQTHVHWVSDTIQPSHSVVPFSSCLLSFQAWRSFPINSLDCNHWGGSQTSIFFLTKMVQVKLPAAPVQWSRSFCSSFSTSRKLQMGKKKKLWKFFIVGKGHILPPLNSSVSLRSGPSLLQQAEMILVFEWFIELSYSVTWLWTAFFFFLRISASFNEDSL